MKTLNPNGINFKYSFLGFVDGWEKTLLLPDYAAEHGLTDKDIENMYIHAKEDVYYTLGAPKELDPKVTKLVPGWDPANDLNNDHYIDDTEFANRVNTNTNARYKNESRIPIYYWGPPTDFQANPGNKIHSDFINYYFAQLVFNSSEYDDPVSWKVATPTGFEVMDEYFSGSHSLLVSSSPTPRSPSARPLSCEGWRCA